jgi:hypothetical protein
MPVQQGERSANALSLIFGLLLFLLACNTQAANEAARKTDADMNYRLDTLVEKPVLRSDSDSTADHSKFEELQAPFMSGPEVTRACLKCHNEAGQQFMKNIHWTWTYENKKTGQTLGKKYLVNTFCTNARGNEGMCAQCHAGTWRHYVPTTSGLLKVAKFYAFGIFKGERHPQGTYYADD